MELVVSPDTELYLITLGISALLACVAFRRARQGDEASASLLALLVTLLLGFARC
ncbi:MAG: hypothetical protein KatS3mg115_1698 [Candidatus Poribacteria bacterium]|nr:MAG: hypothetical protein KatS3mg115_1698 [Candidatus Poribacteria bacterium]